MIEAGRRGLTLAVVAFLLAGCLSDAPTPVPTATPRVTPIATPTVSTVVLDSTAWYAGFVLTFGTATATIDEKGGPVVVDVDVQNPGTADADFDGPIQLSDGSRAVAPSRDSAVPTVPAGTVVTVPMTFDVEAAFDLATAAITVGRPAEHRVVVPLGPDAPGPALLEPRRAESTAAVRAGDLRVAVSNLELRADLPDWNEELPSDRLALTITYTATDLGTFSGGLAFTGANVRLRLADGTEIGPRADGRSQSLLVLQPGRAVDGLFSRFEVPASGGTAWTLVVNDGTTTKALPLELPAP